METALLPNPNNRHVVKDVDNDSDKSDAFVKDVCARFKAIPKSSSCFSDSAKAFDKRVTLCFDSVKAISKSPTYFFCFSDSALSLSKFAFKSRDAVVASANNTL